MSSAGCIFDVGSCSFFPLFAFDDDVDCDLLPEAVSYLDQDEYASAASAAAARCPVLRVHAFICLDVGTNIDSHRLTR